MPYVKILPEKVDGLKFEVYRLKDHMVSDYVTYESLHGLIHSLLGEMHKKCMSDF